MDRGQAPGVEHVIGTASDDVLTVTDNIGISGSFATVDLGAGNNTLDVGSQGLSITALNIEHVNGNSLDNYLDFQNDVSGVSVDLGAGNDTLALANGTNSVSVSNVENITGSDFGGLNPSDDTLTLLNDVNGITINLGDGSNTLDLAAGSNTLANTFGIQTINGSSTEDPDIPELGQWRHRRSRRRQQHLEPGQWLQQRHRQQHPDCQWRQRQ
jgi:hypothetical protein